MDKKHHSLSLSFVLMRYVIITGVMIILLVFLYFFSLLLLQSLGWVLPASYGEQQVQQFLSKQEVKTSFVPEDAPLLVEYALLDSGGHVLDSNSSEKKLDEIVAFYHSAALDALGYAQYSYPDGTTVVFRWRYVAEYANESLRRTLPPYEYLSLGVLALLIIGSLLLTTLILRRKLVKKLRLFGEVSKKVAHQDLDFEVPETKIKEFDDAMGAMDEMRAALKDSLVAQWTAEQQRQVEISALAHDLKTPLTIIGGNAELLLEDGLSPSQKQMVQAIENNTSRAKRYVSSMLSTAAGTDEPFEPASLSVFMDEVIRRSEEIAVKTGVEIHAFGTLMGNATIQFERLCRAVVNVIQNAVEHTPAGQSVKVACMSGERNVWAVQVEDGGSGFSKKALQHATERFWREDAGRSNDGHNGLGLWFAYEVIKEHSGTLLFENGEHGGDVKMTIPYSSTNI